MRIPISPLHRHRRVGSRHGMMGSVALGLTLAVAGLGCQDPLTEVRSAVQLAPTASTFSAENAASFTVTNGSNRLLTLRFCNTGRLQVRRDGRWEHVVSGRGVCVLIGPTYLEPGETSRAFGIPPLELTPGTYRAFQKVWVDASSEIELVSEPFDVIEPAR